MRLRIGAVAPFAASRRSSKTSSGKRKSNAAFSSLRPVRHCNSRPESRSDGKPGAQSSVAGNRLNVAIQSGICLIYDGSAVMPLGARTHTRHRGARLRVHGCPVQSRIETLFGVVGCNSNSHAVSHDSASPAHVRGSAARPQVPANGACPCATSVNATFRVRKEWCNTTSE